MSDLRRRKLPNAEKTADNGNADASDKTRQGPSLSSPTSHRSFGEAGLMFLVFALATAWPVYILLGRRGTGALEESIISNHRAYALCSRTGQQIYTVNDRNELAQCLAVYEDKVLATGDLDYVQKRWAALAMSSNDLSLQGRLPVHYLKPGSAVIPGLSDSHAHILEYGASRQLVLEGTTSIKETITRVRNYVLGDPELFQDTSIWIFGSNWDQTAWTPQAWPTVDDLENDPVLRGRRIVLQSKDYHAIWVSKQVMQSIKEIPDNVDGGAIIRDKSGKATGVFLDSAQSLIQRPPPSQKELEKRLAIAAKDALSFGITSIHDAGFKPISLDFFTKQAAKNALPIRIYGMTYFNESDPYWGDKRQHLIGAAGGRLTCRSVKIFADGALRTGGAALYDPYSDNPETHGFMRISAELLHDIVPKFMRDGWQVNIHAIGDRANSIVLDAFEKAVTMNNLDIDSVRPRLEHAQIMTEDDMKRLGKLGVIASIQPSHVISDMWYAQDRLGPDRVKGLYAFRSIMDSGARLALGTDFPVELMSPFLTFYSAITRLSPEGTSPHGTDGWFPEQRLTRQEALRGLTIEPAYASFTETTLGSLEPGKIADFTILSQDIMKVPANQILQTKVFATFMDGEVVHGSLEAATSGQA